MDTQTLRTCQVRTDLVAFSVRDDVLCVALEHPGSDTDRDPHPVDPHPVQSGNGASVHTLRGRLPGATLRAHEDLDACAQRVCDSVLRPTAYLEQLYTFSPADAKTRALSVAYFAVTAEDELTGKPLQWHALEHCPSLSTEHALIVDKARERLAAKLHYTSLAFHFVQGSFTLSELQRIYETVWKTRLDKRNFRKRILALDDLIEETGRARRDGAHRPARLYRVRAHEQLRVLR